MLKVIQRFGKHCNCHLQGEYVLVGCFWEPHIGQEVGGEWDAKNLIGGAEERAAIQLVISSWLRRRGAENILRGTW
jgi:hypothetical protein